MGENYYSLMLKEFFPYIIAIIGCLVIIIIVLLAIMFYVSRIKDTLYSYGNNHTKESGQ